MKVSILILIMIAYSMTIKAQVLYYYSGATASVAPDYASYYLGGGSYVKRESNYKNDVYVIPETIENRGLEYTVTSLSTGAFAGYQPESNSYSGSLAKSITLPSTIHTIGDYAFKKCPNLISMVIPSSVKSIGKDAFVECNRLR